MAEDPEAQSEAKAMLAGKQYLDAAWVIENAAGGLGKKLAAEFKRKDCPEAAARYALLSRLPFKSIFTTNYDHFLDDGRTPVTQADEPLEIFDRDQVLHLHGQASKPETLVLTSMDFTRTKLFHDRLGEVMRTAAAGSSFLFLGYGMDDEDVRLWLERSC